MNAISINKDIISNWQPQHENLFGKHAIKLNHTLIDTGLFTREALGRLIERCPVEELGLVARTYGEDGTQSRTFGELGNASGLEAIDAIERGKIWMNIRRVMDWAPEYRALLDRVFGEFESRVPGLKTFKHNLGVLISSPNARVFYHADIQGQSLWQISGSKRIFLYPTTEMFVSPQNIEKILLRETDEDMAFKPWYDEFATAIDLQPGEMTTWPLYAPHRVDNHDSLNISVTMEHWTKPIWNSYAVHYGNGVLRRTIGLGNGSTADHGLHVYPKAAAAFLWKKLGKQTVGDVEKKRAFRIDANSANGLVNI
jgi:hypothetical protein